MTKGKYPFYLIDRRTPSRKFRDGAVLTLGFLVALVVTMFSVFLALVPYAVGIAIVYGIFKWVSQL